MTLSAEHPSARRDEGVFDAAPDALLVIDSRGIIVHASGRVESLFGFTRRELRGSPVDRLIPDRFRDLLRERMRAVLAAPPAHASDIGVELSAKRKDGGERPVEIGLSPVRVDGCALVVAAVRDLAPRRVAEPAAREQNESFRLMVQGVSHYGLFMLDPEGRIASWNPGFERLGGYSPSDILGQPIDRFYVPDDVAAGAPAAALRRAVEHEQDVEEGWRLRKNGSRFWAFVVTTALRDNQGRLRGFARLVRDETERRRALRDRERALRWLRTVIESCPVGLLLFEGPSGDHVDANGVAVQLFGRPFDPDRGSEQYRDQIRHADGRPVELHDLPSYRALHAETISAGEEYELRRDDGRTIHVLVSAAPVLDESGEVAGAVVAVDDVTAMKSLERLREEWMSIVAHDLRQPLNVIAMHTQLLGKRRPEDERVKAATDVIVRNATRLDRMIHDLLDLSRLETAKLQLHRQIIDVENQVRAAADRAACVSNRRVNVGVHGTLRPVDADPDRVDQILDNLLSNAVRYSDPGTDVTIDLEGTPEGVAVAVNNRGPGIAPEAMPRLFQRFARDVAHDTKRESIGLGLYITKGLVEAHGGHIEARSTPGAMTTFRFTLPALGGEHASRRDGS